MKLFLHGALPHTPPRSAGLKTNPHPRFAGAGAPDSAPRTAVRHLVLGALVAGLAVAHGGCDTTGFGHLQGGPHLIVDLTGKDDPKITGTVLKPLALAVGVPQPFKITVRAVDATGNPDPTFNGYVRISSKPGAIERINADDADGRNLKLTNGVSPEVEVRVTNAFGTTFILADDLGYQPVDPLRDPPPACADGKDNDGDGKIDYPADEGCAFANDDTETGGSYAAGASVPIFYHLPRVADARGVSCTNPGDPSTCTGGKTPYPRDPLLLDTGYHQKADGSYAYDFDMIVTRISSDGFYVADTKDGRGFNSLFAFNFSSPPKMRVCDRMKTFAGTAGEFFGLTQLSYPTWTLEEWDPQKRPCLVPEPTVLAATDVPNDAQGQGKVTVPPGLLAQTASLVRVQSVGKATIMVTPKFGPDNMPQTNGAFIPGPNATNCDLNKDGKINFDKLPNGDPSDENKCSDACTVDPECTEYSNYAGRSTFRLTVSDENGNKGAIQADATASADFKPLDLKGQVLRSFTGTLTFFSGGSQYTIEARCEDDIIVDPKGTPLPSDKACVFPRTILDDNPQ